MSDGPTERSDQQVARSEAERRRRRARVFGDVLPDATGDERDDGAADRSAEDAAEQWLRQQKPPHHG